MWHWWNVLSLGFRFDVKFHAMCNVQVAVWRLPCEIAALRLWQWWNVLSLGFMFHVKSPAMCNVQAAV